MKNSLSENYKLACKYHSNGDLDTAEKIYKQILAQNENNAEVLNLYGILNISKNNLDKAETLIKQAISLKDDEYYYQTLSRIYEKQNEYIAEIKILEKALKIFDCGFDTHFLLAMAYKNSKEYEKSEESYLKALSINPKSDKALFNLASLYLFLNKPEKAIEYFEKCLEIKPDDIEVKYFLSLAYLQTKDYETGLKYFENRLCRTTAIATQETTYPSLTQKAPLWKGEDISDKTLYTYYEAGFGDMIMFARYIPKLQKRCKKLIIKPQKELSELFRINFPDAEVMDYFYDEKDTDFDFHIPFLSIPYVLGLKNDEIFTGHGGYLKASEEKIKFYKENYFNNDKFNIAIKWQGNTYYQTDRVINVNAFSPLFGLDNVKIFSAQTFEGAEEFEKLSAQYDITDLSGSFKDFSWTAGAVANLDLIICNDTSLAHLAGAMGKPCIVLLPYRYNWRWHTDLKKCDWYDSVKLYRLGKNENWNELLKRITKELLSK